MSKVILDSNDLRACESKVPADVPVTMINLVAYNAEAQYDELGTPAITGADAYLKCYAPAFNEVATELGIEGIDLMYVGAVAQTLVGPAEPRWDAVAIVRYPNFSTLRKLLESPEYLAKAEPHRHAALKSWMFIATFRPSAE